MTRIRTILLTLGAIGALTAGGFGAATPAGDPVDPVEAAPATVRTAADMRLVSAERPVAAQKAVRGCRDARCTITVRVGDRVPIAHRFGFDRLTVIDIGRGITTLEAFTRGRTVRAVGPFTRSDASCPGGACAATFSVAKGETVKVNAVRVRLPKAGAGRATLLLSAPR